MHAMVVSAHTVVMVMVGDTHRSQQVKLHVELFAGAARKGLEVDHRGRHVPRQKQKEKEEHRRQKHVPSVSVPELVERKGVLILQWDAKGRYQIGPPLASAAGTAVAGGGGGVIAGKWMLCTATHQSTSSEP
jgi:hypothetical protein